MPSQQLALEVASTVILVTILLLYTGQISNTLFLETNRRKSACYQYQYNSLSFADIPVRFVHKAALALFKGALDAMLIEFPGDVVSRSAIIGTVRTCLRDGPCLPSRNRLTHDWSVIERSLGPTLGIGPLSSSKTKLLQQKHQPREQVDDGFGIHL